MRNFTRTIRFSFIVLLTTIAFAVQSMAQITLMTESFENSGNVPTGWVTEEVIAGNTISFVTSTSWPSGFTAYNGAYLVMFNSFSASGGLNRLKNITPVSTVGLTDVTVDFAWLESDGYPGVLDRVDVQWSTDGATWNTAGTFNRYNAVTGWKIKSQVLPAGAAGQNTLYIAFLFASAYGDDCYLDFSHLTALENPPPGMITVGTGSVSCNYPYTTFWMGGRTQLIYTSAQLIAAGAVPGLITSIGFDLISYSSQTMQNFNINIMNTTIPTFSGWVDGLQNCYSGSYAVAGPGWQMITLQTPFFWTGDNIILEMCYGNNGSYTSYSYVYGTTAPTGQIQPYWMDLIVGCAYTGGSYVGFTELPNLRFVEQPYTGVSLPFCEDWNSGGFINNNWLFGTGGAGNWSVNMSVGNPAPAADFSHLPAITNYNYSLESQLIDATAWTCGKVWLDFDYKLIDNLFTSTEKLTVEVFYSGSWHQKDEFTNSGNVSWISKHIDVSAVEGQSFKVRFRANGANSANIQHWYVDNICTYAVCTPPTALAATQSGLNTTLTWTAPNCNPMDGVWLVFDDGTADNGWGINPGYNAWIGNEFPLAATTQGVIKAVKFYFWNNPSHGTDQLTVDFFDAAHTLLGSTNAFTVPNDAWDSIAVSDIPFTGVFYAMVHWNMALGSTNWLGYDENGPYAAQNLETYFDGSIWSKLTTVAAANPGVCMLRVLALVNGALKTTEIGPGQPVAATAAATTNSSALSEARLSGDTGDHQTMNPLSGDQSDSSVFIGYNVYRTSGESGTGAFTKINHNPLSDATYPDIYPGNTSPGATFRYYVTDVFNKGSNSSFLCESSSDTITVTTPCSLFSLPFYEDFATTFIPNCWTQADYQANGQIWQFGVITGTAPPALTGNYAFLNSDNYGAGYAQNADLISPPFDLSGYSTVNLGFHHYFRSWPGSSAVLSFSIDNGATWTAIQTFTVSTANPEIFSQDIAGVAGHSLVKFKWNYTGAYGYYWAIDDISITGVMTNRDLENITIGDGTTICYNATNTITVAGNGAPFTVQSGGNVTLIAGHSIRFMPGATVVSGGYLRGYITPNGTYCASPASPVNTTLTTEELPTTAQTETTIFKVYPNPTSGKFTLEFNADFKDVQANVRIYSILGEEVLYENLSGDRKTEFSLSGRSNGVYIIRVMMGDQMGMAKIIKQ
ncbi:MAG: T9SS type A sorting domain-containing protein [Bacteroidota bacterium]